MSSRPNRLAGGPVISVKQKFRLGDFSLELVYNVSQEHIPFYVNMFNAMSVIDTGTFVSPVVG